MPKWCCSWGRPVPLHGPAMLPGAVLAHSQRCVVAAGPANHQAEGLIFDSHHDLFDQRADDPLARRWCRTVAVPGALDVVAKCEQAVAFDLGQCGFSVCHQRIPLVLEPPHGKQTCVPALLQLGCDQTIVRVNRRFSALSVLRASMALNAASMPSG